MKALLVRIAAGLIALAALLYFLACTPPTPNTNTSQNQNLSPNQNQKGGNSASKADMMKPCQYGSEPGSHAQHIKDEIKNRMGPSLKKLLKDPSNPSGTFTVEVQKAESGTYFVARIKGKVSGDDNLKELSNILNDFQNREECLRVIFFLPATPGSAASPGDGFEWSSCEYPMVVCPTGECCMPVDANTNTNTTPLANTNANGNRNANN
jgi:hypothetical protein